MFCRFFIDRPIFATVLSLMITLAGTISINNLPVEQYPNLSPPTICVDASYPGASSEVISESVLAPLEQKINGVEDMIYMNSSASSNGKATISVFFKVGSDPDKAMINVNNRVQIVTATLPEDVRRLGVTVTKRSSSMLQVLCLYSTDSRYDSTYVGNYAIMNIVDHLKRLEGVGDVNVMAGNDYSIRVWLKPDKMAKMGLSVNDIVAAISTQNLQRSVGAIGKSPTNLKVERSYIITTTGRLSDVEQFENVILRANLDGTVLRLRDIADVNLAAASYDIIAKMGGYDAAPMMISLSPGANALATAELVNAKLEELSKEFPSGIAYKTVFESTGFIKNSIKEVVKTLLEAVVLVFAVVLLFLKNFRATIIPCLAVPVSIIGSFAGMMLFGFSVNTLTLFGLVLAIGIVVDDAIVVLENVERLMIAEKMAVRDAVIKAMDEVAGALVAIVLVLCAVFVPVAFMGGLTGTMYKQFAITIAVSVVISGVCALTLTPALCVVFLGEHVVGSKINTNKFFLAFDALFEKISGIYMKTVRYLIDHVFIAFAGLSAILLSVLVLLLNTPGSLVPNEDPGIVMISAVMDPGASLSRSQEVIQSVAKVVDKEPCVKDSSTIAGFSILASSVASNAATMFVKLVDWDQRTISSGDMVKKVFGIGSRITDGMVLAFSPPPIVGMSVTGGFEGYVQRIGDTNSLALDGKVKELLAEAARRPELTGLNTTFNATSPQFNMEVDTLKAMSLQIPISEIYDTMAATFGAKYVNDFSKFGRGFKVMMQSEGKYRSYPEQISEIYVRSSKNVMIPLSSLVKLTPSVGPDIVDRFNVFTAAKIIGSPAPGFTSGQAIRAMEEVASKVLGDEYKLSWTGSAYQEKLTGGNFINAMLLGLLVVFLILAALYERWSLPFVIIFAVPFGIFGAVLAVALRGYSNDIYFQVALITLTGLSVKNAVLIVEFAVMFREAGESIINSALKAAATRFRPIVMTSLAFILGCVPLMVSSGVGCGSRNSLGTGVVGGMIGATVLAPLFIPLMFVLVTRISEKLKKKEESHA
ncbi:MAG: multidrug efflux RND transporter permease subunit [Holosporaceae bacterium]|jgi:multidrug efflux pump|nr:multidrug efflux RND transporter permease subunit [Holosporaceae bacterium]